MACRDNALEVFGVGLASSAIKAAIIDINCCALRTHNSVGLWTLVDNKFDSLATDLPCYQVKRCDSVHS